MIPLQAPVTIKGYLTTTATAGTQVSLRVAIGNNAAPVSADPEYRGEFYIESYSPVVETGKAVMFTATLKPATGTAPAWTTFGAP